MGNTATTDDDSMQERLARFEALLADIHEERSSLDREIERLKCEGKTKTVTFKQHMARRMTLNSFIAMFEEHGL